MKNDMWKAYARGMAAAMNSGGVVVPAGLLRAYKGIGLSDTDMLLIIQLLHVSAAGASRVSNA